MRLKKGDEAILRRLEALNRARAVDRAKFAVKDGIGTFRAQPRRWDWDYAGKGRARNS